MKTIKKILIGIWRFLLQCGLDLLAFIVELAFVITEDDGEDASY